MSVIFRVVDKGKTGASFLGLFFSAFRCLSDALLMLI